MVASAPACSCNETFLGSWFESPNDANINPLSLIVWIKTGICTYKKKVKKHRISYKWFGFTNQTNQIARFRKLDAIFNRHWVRLQFIPTSTICSKKDTIVWLFPIQNCTKGRMKGRKDEWPFVGMIVTNLQDVVYESVHRDGRFLRVMEDQRETYRRWEVLIISSDQKIVTFSASSKVIKDSYTNLAILALSNGSEKTRDGWCAVPNALRASSSGNS